MSSKSRPDTNCGGTFVSATFVNKGFHYHNKPLLIPRKQSKQFGGSGLRLHTCARHFDSLYFTCPAGILAFGKECAALTKHEGYEELRTKKSAQAIGKIRIAFFREDEKARQ